MVRRKGLVIGKAIVLDNTFDLPIDNMTCNDVSLIDKLFVVVLCVATYAVTHPDACTIPSVFAHACTCKVAHTVA